MKKDFEAELVLPLVFAINRKGENMCYRCRACQKISEKGTPLIRFTRYHEVQMPPTIRETKVQGDDGRYRWRTIEIDHPPQRTIAEEIAVCKDCLIDLQNGTPLNALIQAHRMFAEEEEAKKRSKRRKKRDAMKSAVIVVPGIKEYRERKTEKSDPAHQPTPIVLRPKSAIFVSLGE